MKRDKLRIEELESRYFEATISDEEQAELRALLAAQSTLSDEQRALKMMLGGFEAMREEPVASAKPRPMARIIRLAGAISSVAAVVAVALLVFKDAPAPSDEVVYCYINGEPITDVTIAMEQTQYLEPLKNLSQSVEALEMIMNL